jgi:hypothetical protein
MRMMSTSTVRSTLRKLLPTNNSIQKMKRISTRHSRELPRIFTLTSEKTWRIPMIRHVCWWNSISNSEWKFYILWKPTSRCSGRPLGKGKSCFKGWRSVPKMFRVMLFPSESSILLAMRERYNKSSLRNIRRLS